MKKVILLRKTHVEMKSFASPQKHIHASATDLLVQMPQTVTGGVLQNVTKFIGNSFARGNTYEFWKIFKNNFFTEQLQTTASKMRTLQQQSERCCCRELDAMLIASAKILKREESISPSSFYGNLPDYQSQVLVLPTVVENRATWDTF